MAIPDQLTLLSAPPQNDPRDKLQTARMVMRLSPILPLGFLLLMTIITVRSLKNWLDWWGIPLFITGGLTAFSGAGRRFDIWRQSFRNFSPARGACRHFSPPFCWIPPTLWQPPCSRLCSSPSSGRDWESRSSGLGWQRADMPSKQNSSDKFYNQSCSYSCNFMPFVDYFVSVTLRILRGCSVL